MLLKVILKRMSFSDRERMRNSESSEFSIKSEMENSFSHTAVKLENNDFVDSVVLFDDGSLFMDPDMEFKAEPEFFESSEGGMKYSFDSDVSVSENRLQISKREVDKEEESVKTDMKEEYGMQLRSSRREDRGNRRGRGKECLQNEEQIKNSGCEKLLCQESDSKTHSDAGMRENSFACGDYEKQFSEVNPNTHMRILTGGQFRCGKCGKTFPKQVDIKVHYKTCSRKKPFRCSICEKAFPKESKLTLHYRIHTGEKPFKCSVCDKAFTERSKLTIHYRIHTGEKPFKCSFCDKAYPVRSYLTTHNRIHTGEKPFKCSVCDKAFSKRGRLTVHYRIHTGEKPFKCNDCDKAFTGKSNLLRHMKICSRNFFRKHTKEKPFKCSDCDKAYNHSSNLSRHKKICAGENV